MQQFCQYGSVREATGNRRPYRDNSYTPRIRQQSRLEAVVGYASPFTQNDSRLKFLPCQSLIALTV